MRSCIQSTLNNGKKRGFTLVEISIVLVIIGLITAGILVGRTMLRSSEITSLITDSQRYINAVQSFQQKYGSLPGDMSNATSYWSNSGGSGVYTTTCYNTGTPTSVATCNGNGDGQINSTGSYANETLLAWKHMANGSFIQGAFSGNTSGQNVVGTNVPSSRVNNTGFSLAYIGTLSSDTYSFDGKYGHVLYIGGTYTSSPYYTSTGTMTGSEANAIDQKYDDGKPAFGTIRTWKNNAYSVLCATTTVATTAAYTSSTGNLCSLQMITGF